MQLKFKNKFLKFGNFFRLFNSVFNAAYFIHNFYETSVDYFGEPLSSEHIILHPISMGVVPNNEVNTDSNLLAGRNKEVLRLHYFSMKAYFIKYCNDPFLKAYYVNLQKEKNDQYYGFMKFYFSKDEVSRRFGDRLSREDDIPF